MSGAFCEVYGNTIENQVLEYFLENQDIDIAVGDMAAELAISRPKAYQVINEFEEKEYIRKTRTVSGTQLYSINKSNKRVQLFIHDFSECLRLVTEENATSLDQRHSMASVRSVSAKRLK